MSWLVLIVFAPVIIGGVALVSLLLGAAAAGAWESAEEHSQRKSQADQPVHSQVATPGRSRARAA
jgi:hypothetical protein